MPDRIIAAALTLCLATLAPRPAAALDPLPPEAAAALAGIRADKPPEKLTQDTHFVVSDELRHDQFRAAIQGLGGAFIGVGTDQNYTMAAWARPEVIVLLDFDWIVVYLHKVYGLAFARCAEPACFTRFWSEKNRPEVIRLISEIGRDNPRLGRRMLSAFRMGQKRVHRRLRRLREVYAWLKVPHFLTDQGQYNYLRAMFKAGRVFMVRGDLTADVTMKQLGAALRQAGLVARVLYISNCEQYFKYSRQYRKNIRGIPGDPRSVVLRTRAWREWVSGGKGKLHYLYATQTQANYRGWLGHREVKSVKQLIPYRILKPGVLSYAITDTFRQRREAAREARRQKRRQTRMKGKKNHEPGAAP